MDAQKPGSPVKAYFKDLKPKLFSLIRTYTADQFVKDVISGIIVAIIALPLSIALALASGVGPEQGLYTAVVAGFIIAFLGGSRVQIAGPTAAFATIVAGIVAEHGMEGLATATILAGIILVVMGFCKLGSLIKYIPYTITTGFTAGIAVTIAVGQVRDFLGLTFDSSPVETMEKVEAIAKNFGTLNWQALMIGVISMAILILWPCLKYLNKIPGSLIAVLVTGAIVRLGNLQVNTIGSLYTISAGAPQFHMPVFSLKEVGALLPDAFTIAILAGIESLLSCVVADGMIGSRHKSNAELVAQGLGNVGSALFGGIPATGAIARTAANIRNGGRTPVAGIVHSVTLLLILVLLMPYASLIPMPAIAAILFMVAYNMCGYREFARLVRRAPKSDVLVLIATFVLTIVFDLVVAIEIGIILAAILFMKRMSDTAEIYGWKYIEDEEEDAESIHLRKVPKHTLVYEINGPMFFAAADKFMTISLDPGVRVIILRMRSVPAMDMTALHTLENVRQTCEKRGITLVLSHVQEQPLAMMKKAGFVELVGAENFCENIDAALERAGKL